MTSWSDSGKEDDLEAFLSGRDIYKVRCEGEGEWRDWKRKDVVTYPGGSDQEESRFKTEIEQGDIIIAQAGQGHFTHIHGIGAVAESYNSEQSPIDLETSSGGDGKPTQLWISTHWSTVADNGEDIEHDIPESYPTGNVTQTDESFFRDLLVGINEGSYPPPADDVVGQLFKAAALKDLDSLIDMHLPETWEKSEEQKSHIRNVVNYFLTKVNTDPEIAIRRDFAISKSIQKSKAPQDAVENSCGEGVWGDKIEDGENYLEQYFDPALEKIEKSWLEGRPWETACSNSVASKPELPLSEWLREAIEDDFEYFILKTGDGGYEDKPSESYHFKEGIQGSLQLPEAGTDARFIYFEDGEFYAVGSFGEFDSETRDGTEHLFAHVDDYYEIDSIKLSDVKDDISNAFPQRFGIVKIDQADYESILRTIMGRDIGDIIDQLLQEESTQAWLYKEALAHIVAGKNIVFYGPPGTGKTRAARKLSNVICEGDFSLVTANSEWSNYQVIGGYAPSDSGGFEPKPGFLTEAAEDAIDSLNKTSLPHPSWLIIDELNRANLDEAFGDVFTLLDVDYRTTREITYAPGADSVALPLSFRILATMNTYDKAQLFSLGYAFRRRFAFVNVPSLMTDGNRRTETSSPEMSLSTDDLQSGSQTTLEVIRGTLTDKLRLGIDDQSGVAPEDVAVVLHEMIDLNAITESIDRLEENETLSTGEPDWLETLVYFAQSIMERDIIDIGQALLIDAAKFIVAYDMLFPEDTDRSVLDRAIVSYLLPQFEHFMPKLRRAETIEQDSSAIDDFEEIITAAEKLGLPETAAVLKNAKEDKRILE